MPPAPTTVITQPIEGAVVGGTITVKATATDHSGSNLWFIAFDYTDDTHPMPGSPVFLPVAGATYNAELDFDTTVLLDGDHLLLVRSVDNLSEVGPFDTVTVTVHNAPPPPVNLDTVSDDGQLTVVWEPGGPSTSTWRVYHELSNGTWALDATVAPGTFSHTDTGLVNGQPYSYYVTAVDPLGNESYPSLVVTGSPFKPPPPLTPFAQTLYDELEPLKYGEQGADYPLAHYCAALAKPFDEIWDYVVTPDTPWSTVVDLDKSPVQFIDWLGRFKGVATTRATLTDLDKRNRIRHAAGFDRGTITTMSNRAKANLTGTKHLTTEERVGGSAWQIRFTVYSTEAPDTATLLKEILAVKPGGIVFTLIVAPSETWNEAGTTTWNAAPGGMTWDTATSGI